MYDFDLNIIHFKRCIKLLEKVVLKKGAPETQKYLDDVLSFKIVQTLYKNGTNEQIQI